MRNVYLSLWLYEFHSRVSWLHCLELEAVQLITLTAHSGLFTSWWPRSKETDREGRMTSYLPPGL